MKIFYYIFLKISELDSSTISIRLPILLNQIIFLEVFGKKINEELIYFWKYRKNLMVFYLIRLQNVVSISYKIFEK